MSTPWINKVTLPYLTLPQLYLTINRRSRGTDIVVHDSYTVRRLFEKNVIVTGQPVTIT